MRWTVNELHPPRIIQYNLQKCQPNMFCFNCGNELIGLICSQEAHSYITKTVPKFRVSKPSQSRMEVSTAWGFLLVWEKTWLWPESQSYSPHRAVPVLTAGSVKCCFDSLKQDRPLLVKKFKLQPLTWEAAPPHFMCCQSQQLTQASEIREQMRSVMKQGILWIKFDTSVIHCKRHRKYLAKANQDQKISNWHLAHHTGMGNNYSLLKFLTVYWVSVLGI